MMESLTFISFIWYIYIMKIIKYIQISLYDSFIINMSSKGCKLEWTKAI